MNSPKHPTLVHRPLLPAFDHCEGLRTADLTRVVTACARLEGDIRDSTYSRAPAGSIEVVVASHLAANPEEIVQLCAMTRCDLTEHWIGVPRRLDALRDASRFAAAFDVASQGGAGTSTPPWLIALARAAAGRHDLSFRTLEARTSPDARNCSVVYPDAKRSLPRVRSICERFASLPETRCIASVFWCMAAFLNAHPLPDGNGRVGRLLFALGMHRVGLVSGPWLAIGPLIYASNGAFEIAVRRAEIQSRWQPLIDLMAIYIEFLDTIVAKSAITRSPTCI